jgi:hypothetical protein
MQHESDGQADGVSKWDTLRDLIEELVVDIESMTEVGKLARNAYLAKLPPSEDTNSNPAPEKAPTEFDTEWPNDHLISNFYDLLNDPVVESSMTNGGSNYTNPDRPAGETSITQVSNFVTPSNDSKAEVSIPIPVPKFSSLEHLVCQDHLSLSRGCIPTSRPWVFKRQSHQWFKFTL